MKDEKDLKSTKMDQRGKTPDRKKKKRPTVVGVYDVCPYLPKFFYDVTTFHFHK
jgi:hypothetical protein